MDQIWAISGSVPNPHADLLITPTGKFQNIKCSKKPPEGGYERKRLMADPMASAFVSSV
jgi:hypothetical protein